MKGQSLFEVLLALAIASTVATAITVIVVASLSNAEAGKNQSEALTFAQQGIDVLRNMRNTNYSTFISAPANTYCLATNCNQLDSQNNDLNNPSCGYISNTFVPKCSNLGVNSQFIRIVSLNQNAANCQFGGNGIKGTKVIVSVVWSDTKCTDPLKPFCHTSQIATCFTNYAVLPTPGTN